MNISFSSQLRSLCHSDICWNKARLGVCLGEPITSHITILFLTIFSPPSFSHNLPSYGLLWKLTHLSRFIVMEPILQWSELPQRLLGSPRPINCLKCFKAWHYRPEQKPYFLRILSAVLSMWLLYLIFTVRNYQPEKHWRNVVYINPLSTYIPACKLDSSRLIKLAFVP